MDICQDFEFFEASPRETDEIFALWRQVFRSWSDETAAVILDRLNAGFLSGTVKIPAVRSKSSNKIIAAARLEVFTFAGKNAHTIKTGIHVGEVAVLPDVQGGGLGTYLMTNTVNLLKTRPWNATFAFLGGYTVFYSRFGFKPVAGSPRIEIKLTPEKGGVRSFSVMERISRPPEETFRKFDIAGDRDDFLALQPWIPEQRIFTKEIFDREFRLRKDCFELECNVYPCSGKVKSYLFCYDNCIYSFSTADREGTVLLLHEALHKIAGKGFKTAVVSCNPDFTEKFLTENLLPFSKICGRGGLCSQMQLELQG